MGIDNFYKQAYNEDTYSLPLIKPYRLWTPIGGRGDWYLDLKKPINPKSNSKWSQITVCDINIQNRIIFGCCGKRDFFIVLPDSSFEKIYQDKNEWILKLKELGIWHSSMYPVDDIYDKFKKDYKSLPWYEQVKN